MVRLSKSHQGSLPQWHSSHLPFSNKSFHKFHKKALKKEININIPDPEMVEYGDKGPSSITANVLYLPKLTNQVALNSFILFKNFLYIFQFTIAKWYDIKPGLIDWYERCSGVPHMTCWCFVFVIDVRLCNLSLISVGHWCGIVESSWVDPRWVDIGDQDDP